MKTVNNFSMLSLSSGLLFERFAATLHKLDAEKMHLQAKAQTDLKDSISALLVIKLLQPLLSTQTDATAIQTQNLANVEQTLLDFCRNHLHQSTSITALTSATYDAADAHLGLLAVNYAALINADVDITSTTRDQQSSTYDHVFSNLSSLYSSKGSSNIDRMILFMSATYYQWQKHPTEEHANIVRAVLDWLDDLQDPYTGLISSGLAAMTNANSFIMTHAYVSLSLACERAIKHPTRIIEQALHFLKAATKETTKTNWGEQHQIIVASSLLLLRLKHHTDYREAEIQDQIERLTESVVSFVQDAIGNDAPSISAETCVDLACFIYQVMMNQQLLSLESAPTVLPGHLAWQPCQPINPTHHFERVIPTEPQAPMYVIRNQVARYNFARTFIRATDRVLDIGCGSGWGAHYLSFHCAQIVGTDVAHDSLSSARNTYFQPNLQYVYSDNIADTFAGQEFNVVTCFEVLEHVDRTVAKLILKGIQQLLSPTGKLIGTTPIVRGKSGNARPRNPYHIYEYSAPELVQLLQEIFPCVEVHAIGTRGSLAFVASNDNAMHQSTDGLTAGAEAFYEDAKRFLQINDPVWAFETALRSATLLPQHYQAWGLLCRAGIRISLQRSHRRKFMSALLWRKHLSDKKAAQSQ